MKTVSRFAPVALRLMLGLVFTGAGIAGLLQRGAAPPGSGPAAAFVGGLAAAGYFFPLLKIVELGAGLLLLWGRMVPFALTLLAPIVVNIAAFHFVLAPEGAPIAVLLVALEIGLAWLHRDAFAPLFRRAPTSVRPEGQTASLAAALGQEVGQAR
jgi:hypothetical protein